MQNWFSNRGLGPSRGPRGGSAGENKKQFKYTFPSIKNRFIRRWYDDFTDVGIHSLHCYPPRLHSTLKQKLSINNEFQLNTSTQKELLQRKKSNMFNEFPHI